MTATLRTPTTTLPLAYLFEMMHHGRYSFEQFLTIPVEEHYQRVNWRNRTIYKPSKTLKALHTFLRVFVLAYLPVNERVSFAYRKGASLRGAVEPHTKSRVFFQTDLSKFFDSITVDMVRDAVLEAQSPIGDIETHLDRIVELTTVGGSLAIGYSTSPILSNSCLRAFDNALEEACKKSQLIYSRYADDIVVSAQDISQLESIDQRIEQLLTATTGPTFHLNTDKSRIIRVGRKVKILGLNILPSGRITVDRELRAKVETQLYFYLSDRARFEQIVGDHEGGLQKLSGYISHIHSADPEYLEKLRRKFGNTLIDSFLHRSAQ